MTTLAPTYNFRGHPVRRLTFRGELAFLGREIGGALGYDRGGSASSPSSPPNGRRRSGRTSTGSG